jgi:hypothetical protein
MEIGAGWTTSPRASLADGDAGFRVRPLRPEILEGGSCLCVSPGRDLRRQRQLWRRTLGKSRIDPAIIKDLLKFRRNLA